MKIKDILSYIEDEGYIIKFYGDKDEEIIGFSSLSNYEEGCLTWIKTEERYKEFSRKEDIACAIIQSGIQAKIRNAIISDCSKQLFFDILQHFSQNRKDKADMRIGSVIGENVKLEDNVAIGCNSTIVGDIIVGENTIIEHNVVIQGRVTIGSGCHIQSGVIIGVDGFGYSYDSQTGIKKMIEHFGGVRIGNNVFVGSCTNIARGVLDDTVIDDNVKIAPSTHIGHNVRIGSNTTVICSNIFGSAEIGKDSYITASTVKNQKKVGENTVIGMGSVVNDSINDNLIAYGIPAKGVRENDLKL